MKAVFIIIPILFFLSSCNKQQTYINSNIMVIGHGGLGNRSSLPMNSLESMLACYHSGANGNELDVQMTSDGVLVALHAFDLSETTSLNGMVNAHTWEELRKGYYLENPYLNYKIVSLDQVFSAMNVAGNNYLFTLDCKLYNYKTEQYNEKFADQIVEIVKKYDIEQRVLLESQDESFLRLLQSKNKSIRLFLYTGTAAEGIPIALQNGFYGISLSTRNITKEEVMQAQAHNLKVAIWNIHSKKDNREAIEKQADFIQTEQVSYLLDLL